MSQETRRTAFTLIELLTVMAIITLLIGILTPSLSAARNRATKTAILAQINAMATGLDFFTADQGEYPPSNAILMADDPANNPDPDMADWEVGTSTEPLQGAHLLKDALVGRDSLGYDRRRTNSTVYDRWDPTNDRQPPYVKVDGISVTSRNEPPEDGFGVIPPGVATTAPPISGSGSQPLDVNVFRDKFGWPILYYRASPTANQNTPIMQTGFNAASMFFGDGVYDGDDNRIFTSYNMGPPSDPQHRISDAEDAIIDLNTPPVPGNVSLTIEALTNNFGEFIRSFRATTFDSTNPREILWPRPVNSDTFILLSAGKDGQYGTLDDIANFNVLSKER